MGVFGDGGFPNRFHVAPRLISIEITVDFAVRGELVADTNRSPPFHHIPNAVAALRRFHFPSSCVKESALSNLFIASRIVPLIVWTYCLLVKAELLCPQITDTV